MKASQSQEIRIGCAGWSVPHEHAEHFSVEGSHLERYARRFRAVEINSSFYRPHRPATYARWAASVPDGFRFAVKVPKEISHVRLLEDPAEALERFLGEVSELGDRCGPLLVQLPPSLTFATSLAEKFFATMRERFAGDVVCEPRHGSWFRPAADKLLARFQVARVAADPAVVPQAVAPGGWDGLAYYRLHGAPRMYYSSYATEYLVSLGDQLIQQARSMGVWCIFDNTAQFAATANALDLQQRVGAVTH